MSAVVNDDPADAPEASAVFQVRNYATYRQTILKVRGRGNFSRRLAAATPKACDKTSKTNCIPAYCHNSDARSRRPLALRPDGTGSRAYIGYLLTCATTDAWPGSVQVPGSVALTSAARVCRVALIWLDACLTRGAAVKITIPCPVVGKRTGYAVRLNDAHRRPDDCVPDKGRTTHDGSATPR
jgi:hypothetical protein